MRNGRKETEMTLLIKNGRVIDPGTKQDKVADVFVRDGRIEKVMPQLQEAPTRSLTHPAAL